MKYPLVKERAVVVTGASSGIGAATARVLAARGWRVFPTARKAADLEKLRAEGFEAIELDLADAGSVERAAAEIRRLTGGKLGALVNNAGYGQPGALEDLPRAAMRQQMETNVVGTQDLTNRLIPLFRSQQCGRIVYVSSVVGRIVIPFMGIYCASKHAVEALGDILRVELAPAGISVSLVEPGPIATSFRKRAVSEAAGYLQRAQSVFAKNYDKELGERREYKRPTDRFRLPPEAVAEKIAHALESPRPKTRYPVTVPAYLGDLLARFCPDRIKDRLLTMRMFGKRTTTAHTGE